MNIHEFDHLMFLVDRFAYVIHAATGRRPSLELELVALLPRGQLGRVHSRQNLD